MRAEDLRIGNLVNVSSQLHVIVELLSKEASCEWVITSPEIMIDSYMYDELKPIPLTEDWLLRLGFERINHISDGIIFVKDSIKINESLSVLYQGAFLGKYKHVHQLQNLYYSLTQKELTYEKRN